MTQIECTNCGTQNPADSSFCSSCGLPLARAASGIDAEHPAAGPLSSAVQAAPPSEPAAHREEATPREQPPDGSEGQDRSAEGDVSPEPVVVPVPASADTPEVAPPLVAEAEVPISEPAPSAEQAIYHADAVARVTGDRAELGSKIYAIDDIRSVAMETRPANRIFSVLLAVVGAAVIIVSLLDVLQDPRLALLFTVGGLILLGIGIFLAATARTTYALRIQSATGTADALLSPDRSQAVAIVDALEKAIADRG